ncbi:hypothetical protein Tco_1516780 [Tanacetum coccineum]
MDKEGYGIASEAKSCFKRSVLENGSDIAEQSGEVSRTISGPVGSRLAFTPTEPQRERHPMARPSVIGPTDWNEALEIISPKVADTFDVSLMGASSRSCKYVINTLMQAFQNKRFAHAVNQRTLDYRAFALAFR